MKKDDPEMKNWLVTVKIDPWPKLSEPTMSELLKATGHVNISRVEGFLLTSDKKLPENVSLKITSTIIKIN